MAVRDHFDTVQKLYIAFYQRPADPAGLVFWAGRIDAAGGNLTAAIDAFATSEEAVRLYGPINSNTIGDVIEKIYQALFKRSADAPGKAFYIDGFDKGTFTAVSIALNVLNGAQNADKTAIDNKIAVSRLFTQAVDGRDLTDAAFGTGTQFAASYDQAREVAAREYLSTITEQTPVKTPAEAKHDVQVRIAKAGDRIFDGADALNLTGLAGNHSIDAGTGNDSITGSAGNDSLMGAAGNDTLNGGAGNDTLDGGEGADLALLSGNFAEFAVKRLGPNAYTLTKGAEVKTIRNVENFQFSDGTRTQAQVDAASGPTVGGEGNDMLNGTTGDDNIDGSGGDDQLNGLGGNDTLTGGLGNDTLDGGDGNDLIFGGAGNDSLLGGAGNDTIDAGAGNDTIDGGADADRVVLNGTFADFTIRRNADGSYTLTAGDGSVKTVSNVETYGFTDGDRAAGTLPKFSGGPANDTYTGDATDETINGGAGNDTLNGAGGRDSLIGGSGNDALTGGDGTDTLVGGEGNDTLNGGAASDRFSFSNTAATNGTDTVSDFTVGLGGDKLDFSAFIGTVTSDDIADAPALSASVGLPLLGGLTASLADQDVAPFDNADPYLTGGLLGNTLNGLGLGALSGVLGGLVGGLTQTDLRGDSIVMLKGLATEATVDTNGDGVNDGFTEAFIDALFGAGSAPFVAPSIGERYVLVAGVGNGIQTPDLQPANPSRPVQVWFVEFDVNGGANATSVRLVGTVTLAGSGDIDTFVADNFI